MRGSIAMFLLIGGAPGGPPAAAREAWPPFWPEWSGRQIPAEACRGDIAAALSWISEWSGTPCIVPVPDEGDGGPPTWLRQPAGRPLPCDVYRAVHNWARENEHEGFTTPHCVVMAPLAGRAWGHGPHSSPEGVEAGLVHLAMATAPPDVATQLAAGFMVLAQQLSGEAQAEMVRIGMANPAGSHAQHSLDTPMGVLFSLTPALLFGGYTSERWGLRRLPLDDALRECTGATHQRLGVPRTISLDLATHRVAVTEWESSAEAVFPGDPPRELTESVEAFQTEWRATRQRLHALQQASTQFGGPMSVGDLCRAITLCPVDPGPFANEMIWSTPGRCPTGSALQCLALAMRARVTTEGAGLRLAPADGYAIPEPMKLGLRWASSQLPERQDLRLACQALDDPPLRPLAELDPVARDAVRAAIATSEHPPTVVDATMVRLGLDLGYLIKPLLLTRDEAEVASGTVSLRLSHRPGSGSMSVGSSCPHLLVDPYLLDVLP